MKIKEFTTHFLAPHDYYIVPLCPKCRAATLVDYQRYCHACGQRLHWDFNYMTNTSTTLTHIIVRKDNNLTMYVGTLTECKQALPEIQSESSEYEFIIHKI